jgi:hypothetical protein
MAKHDVIEEAITDALSKEKGGNCSRSFASVTKVMYVCTKLNIITILASTSFPPM